VPSDLIIIFYFCSFLYLQSLLCSVQMHHLLDQYFSTKERYPSLQEWFFFISSNSRTSSQPFFTLFLPSFLPSFLFPSFLFLMKSLPNSSLKQISEYIIWMSISLCMFPCLFQFLDAVYIPWLVAISSIFKGWVLPILPSLWLSPLPLSSIYGYIGPN
jgi:hypothetical protein